MALLTGEWYSQSLAMQTSVCVLHPQDQADFVDPPAVLFLFHGLGDSAFGWLRRSRLERYLTGRNIAVVMPEVGRSFYANEVGGLRFGDYVRSDLVPLTRRVLGLACLPARTAVAGLSMGGYGAMAWALANPRQFRAAGSFGGSLDVARRWREPSGIEQRRIFGTEPLDGGAADLLAQLARVRDPETYPAFYTACGTDDSHLAAAKRFAAAAQAAGLDVTQRYGPGGHDWDVWDRDIAAFLDWLESHCGW